MKANPILNFLVLSIIALSVFILIYLKLYFFKKQESSVATFSQRVMSFAIDMAMFNAIALGIGIVKLFMTGAVTETWRTYIEQMKEYGMWYLWSDLRIIETYILLVHIVYATILEIVRKEGSLGRNAADLFLLSKSDESKLSAGKILLRNIIKYAPLVFGIYYMGWYGVLLYMIILYSIYRVNRFGMLPHDFAVRSVVSRKPA